MKYNCKTISISKVPLNTQGLIESLCDRCTTRDCTNSVENRKVSILGIKREMRVIAKGQNVYIVIQCEGFYQ